MNYVNVRELLLVISTLSAVATLTSLLMLGGIFWYTPVISIVSFAMMKLLDKAKENFDKKYK